LAGVGVVASWSWWWVTSPLWIPAGIIIGILLVVCIVWLVSAICEYFASRRPRRPIR
jgi:hypothetical protein